MDEAQVSLNLLALFADAEAEDARNVPTRVPFRDKLWIGLQEQVRECCSPESPVKVTMRSASWDIDIPALGAEKFHNCSARKIALSHG